MRFVKAASAITLLLSLCTHQSQAANAWPPVLLNEVPVHAGANPIPVVVVRFPMMVADADKEALSTDYSDKMYPGGNAGSHHKDEIVPAVVHTLLTKSLYYGMQLGECLAAKSESGYHVILEPSTIGRKDGRWQFTSDVRPAQATVLVDFMPWSSAYSSMINIGTFGQKIAPFVTVRASPAALVQTKGLAYVYENWFAISSSESSSFNDARAAMGAALPEFLNTRAQKSGFGFVSPWKKLTPQLPSAVLAKVPGPYSSGMVTPVPELHLELKRDKAPADEPENEQTCVGVTHMVRSVLADSAVRAIDAQRPADYAQQLSAASGGTISAEKLLQQPEALAKFLEAEVQLLKAQDDKLRQLLLTPDFSTAWAQLREDETKASRKQNVKNWLAVGVMAAGTGAGLGGDVVTMNANTLIAEKMMANTAKTAGAQVMALSDVYTVLGDYSVEVVVDGEPVQAKSHADLRNTLVSIFQRRFP